MDVAVGPAVGAGAGDGVVDHRARAADVDVATQRAVGQHGGDVELLALVEVVQVHAVAILALQLLAQARVFGAAHGQMHFERLAGQAQLGQLRAHRSDAHAAGDEQVQARMLAEWEQVDRKLHFQLVTFLHVVVHRLRTATARFDTAHGDLVGAGVVRRAHQRIGVAVHAIGMRDQHDDVAATGERRQVRTVGGNQGEAADVRGDVFGARNAHAQGSVVLAHVSSSSASGSSPGTSASALTAWKAARRRE
ncbi:hypothetical protein D3C76_1073670 [compost metagenome]